METITVAGAAPTLEELAQDETLCQTAGTEPTHLLYRIYSEDRETNAPEPVAEYQPRRPYRILRLIRM